MSEWWSGLSIKNKLQIPIQLILLVVLALTQRWALQQYEKLVIEDAINRASIPADGVFNGLNMMMLNGTITDGEQRRLFVKKMAASGQVGGRDRIVLFNTGSALKYLDNRRGDRGA